MTDSRPAPVKTFTGIQKAAVLLSTLGDEEGADILRHLSAEDVQLLAREAARLKEISSTQVESVLEEFRQLASPKPTRSFDAQTIADLLRDEHPQTLALVLSRMRATQAAALVGCLPADVRSDAAARLALLSQISPEILRKFSAIIERKLAEFTQLMPEPRGGAEAVAAILNRLDPAIAQEIEGTIEAHDRDLIQEIRGLLFAFEDLADLDRSAMREIIGRVEPAHLTIALTGAGEHLREHVLQCMPAADAEAMRRDIQSNSPVRIRELDIAQQEIIRTIRALAAAELLPIDVRERDRYGL